MNIIIGSVYQHKNPHYTTPDFYDNYYKKEIKNIPHKRIYLFIFNLTFNNLYEVPCVKNLSTVFENMTEMVREKGLHNSDLYAVWNSKLYFIREVTFIYPNYQVYFWVDSGVVRDSIYTRMYDKNGNIGDSNLNNSKCFHVAFPSLDDNESLFKSFIGILFVFRFFLCL